MRRKEEPVATQVLSLLEEAQGDEVSLAISIINLGEVVYRIGKVKGETAAWETPAELQQLPLQVLPADEELVWSAVGWKMYHALSYADVFASAAADRHSAVLLTGDPELMRLREGVRIERLALADR